MSLKQTIITRISKYISWILGLILIFIVAISFLDPDAEGETWLFMGIAGLVVSVVVWVNQRLSIRPVDSKDKNLVIQCIVFFLII